jgi:DNA-directed RNA polymerase subunit RPC12/RpoP
LAEKNRTETGTNTRPVKGTDRKMSWQCPKCSSEDFRKLSVIYESGTQTGTTKSTSTGRSSSAYLNAFDRQDVAHHRSTTVSESVHQTAQAAKCTPPGTKKLRGAIGGIAVFGFFFLVTLSSPGLWTLVWAALCAGLGYYVYSAFKYNRGVYPTLVEEWRNSYLCLRCDTIFRMD